MKFLLFSLFVALSSCRSADSAKGFALVELFTSEGCSSCPPADRLVARLQKEFVDGPVYILAYHVDYWDRQGWKDRFSDHAFTLRQGQYMQWLHLPSVYTPQVVVNGASENVGSNEAFLRRAITAGLNARPGCSLTLRASVTGRKAVIDYKATGADTGSAVVLALVQKEAQTDVKAGENEGRTLSHVQIVRVLQRVDLSGTSVTMDLPADFAPGGWEVIGWVQRENDGPILGAARAKI